MYSHIFLNTGMEMDSLLDPVIDSSHRSYFAAVEHRALEVLRPRPPGEAISIHHRVVISRIESSLFSVRSASLFTVLSYRFFRCITLHTPGIRTLCAYKYSEVCELPAALEHRSSLYTQCLEVGLAGRITMVLGKEKGEERRPHNMGGASWT